MTSNPDAPKRGTLDSDIKILTELVDMATNCINEAKQQQSELQSQRELLTEVLDFAKREKSARPNDSITTKEWIAKLFVNTHDRKKFDKYGKLGDVIIKVLTLKRQNV